MTERHKPKFAAVVLVIVATAASTAAPPPAGTPSTDEARIQGAVVSMYDAFTRDDRTKFDSVAAPDFYSFDGGKRYTGTELMALIASLHAAGNVYVWQVTEPEVHIDGNMAWITWVNRGSIRNASGTRDVSWLESAILRKGGDGWRIRFFHSTRVP